MKSIGIDIGASHISCGLYNSILKKLECKLYMPNKMDKKVDIDISTQKFIYIVIDLIDKLLNENNILISEVSSIGLGCPGGIDRENSIFLGSSELNVKEINWKKELEKYNLDIFIENDCTCAGICESYMNDWNDFIMFTLGSGLGIAYIKNYKCMEEFVWKIASTNKKVGTKHDKYIRSFRSLSKRYNQLKQGEYNRTEIFKCIEKGDFVAQILLKDYIHNFIEGLRKIEEVYHIKDFCIGGGMTEYAEYFINDIKQCVPNLNIQIAKFKNDAGIIGAALLEYLQKE